MQHGQPQHEHWRVSPGRADAALALSKNWSKTSTPSQASESQGASPTGKPSQKIVWNHSPRPRERATLQLPLTGFPCVSARASSGPCDADTFSAAGRTSKAGFALGSKLPMHAFRTCALSAPPGLQR
jgi:hypothetical protein